MPDQGGTMSQFGGSSSFGSKPSNDDYGFFTTPPPAQSESQFGGPASAPPQFGSPAGFGTPHPNPYTATTGPPTTKNPALVAGAALLLVAVLVVGGWFGWQAYQRSKAVTIPTTLAGLPQSTDPEIAKGVDEAVRQLEGLDSSLRINGAGYGNANRLALLVIGRGSVNDSAGFSDIQANVAAGKVLSPVQIGKNTCGSVAKLGVAFCVRTSSTMFAEVVLLSGTAPEASAALDEAWAAQ